MDQKGGLRVDEDVKLIFDYLKDYKNYINKLLSNTSDIEGMTTGIEELDKITGGFKEGELTVLAARTSIGKTSIALYMALQAAKLLNDHEKFRDLKASKAPDVLAIREKVIEKVLKKFKNHNEIRSIMIYVQNLFITYDEHERKSRPAHRLDNKKHK